MENDMQKALQQLDGLHYSFPSQDKRFLILFKLCSDLQSKSKRQAENLILRVFDGKYFWMQQITHSELNQIRRRSEVEGSDSTLCDMIKISMENGSYNLKQDGNILNLQLQFQLGKGVFVKAELSLGESVPVTNDQDFKLLNQMFIFDLYDVMKRDIIIQTDNFQKERVLREQDQKMDKQQPMRIQQEYSSQKIMNPEPLFKNMKIKPKADMIRPTMRKRKGVGAKLD